MITGNLGPEDRARVVATTVDLILLAEDVLAESRTRHGEDFDKPQTIEIAAVAQLIMSGSIAGIYKKPQTESEYETLLKRLDTLIDAKVSLKLLQQSRGAAQVPTAPAPPSVALKDGEVAVVGDPQYLRRPEITDRAVAIMSLVLKFHLAKPPASPAQVEAAGEELEEGIVEQLGQAVADEREVWEGLVRTAADDLWKAAKEEGGKNAVVEELLKRISSNLHRLCTVAKGQEPLPAPGSRL